MTDLSKPVQTRHGYKVEIIRYDLNHPHYPVIGIITGGGTETVMSWSAKGEYIVGNANHRFDLVNIPPERVSKFRNVYTDRGMGEDHSSIQNCRMARVRRAYIGIMEFVYENDVLVNTIWYKDQ